MRRRLIAAVAAAGLFAAVAAPAASADFPEQPGTHVQTGCNAVLTNPGTGGGRLTDIIPPDTNALLSELLTDACTFD
jgi:hypothetical protein